MSWLRNHDHAELFSARRGASAPARLGPALPTLQRIESDTYARAIMHRSARDLRGGIRLSL